MNTKVLLSDPKKCNGCGLCRTACSLGHEGVCNPERSRMRVIEMDLNGHYLPFACQQCEDAPCARACPKEAISRDNALVRTMVDYNLCVGCGMCVHACPFGAMGFDDERGRPFKCDLCDGSPLCVGFCTPEALKYEAARKINFPKIREAARKYTGIRR